MITARAIHQISGTLPQIAQIAGPSGGWALLGEIPFSCSLISVPARASFLGESE
jgi:hypothetical protein